MDIIFKARHTDVRDRFRQYASAKLSKIEKLAGKAIRMDVQIKTENTRAAAGRERVELTVISRGPAIRAEAAAEDRFAAFDLALDKLDSRLRRACDRRKGRHGGGLLAGNGAPGRAAKSVAADMAEAAGSPGSPGSPGSSGSSGAGAGLAARGEAVTEETREIPVDMQGDGPLVVREKFHTAAPMGIDQALFEMELVGHDFFLFLDAASGLPSVVYRRRGYQYGVIRLIEEYAFPAASGQGQPGRVHAGDGPGGRGSGSRGLPRAIPVSGGR